MMIVLIWLVAIVAALVLYHKKVYSRFSKYGVKNPPIFPFMGNAARSVFKLEHMCESMVKSYEYIPSEKFIGTYSFVFPVLFVRDLELIKKITVKDFDHFLDHKSFVEEDVDPLMGRNLFALKGQEWRDMRSTLSPAFTSSKIRLMVPFMVEVGGQMMKSLKEKIEASEMKYVDLECKDLLGRYTTDVIASCAFGLKVDSHTDKDNEFYKMAKFPNRISLTIFIKFFILSLFPKISKKLNLTMFEKKFRNFFFSLVLNTMKDREVNKIYRPDMIQLLMDAKKGTLTHDKSSVDMDAGFATVEESDVGKKDNKRVWSDTDLIAQATLFFVAGFDSVANAMVFTLYELAVNPDVQDRLVQEIRDNDEKNGGKFDYNSIQRMTYMDMVISEALRLWPPAIATDRVCVKDYNIGKPNESAAEDYIIRRGEMVQIPIWAVHRNAEYFPNPNKFDPERFSEENKHKIKAFTYVPFGFGPRNCIGSRFALCEVKVMLYQLLQHMEVSPCEKTSIPAELDKNSFTIGMKGGNWLRFKIRE